MPTKKESLKNEVQSNKKSKSATDQQKIKDKYPTEKTSASNQAIKPASSPKDVSAPTQHAKQTSSSKHEQYKPSSDKKTMKTHLTIKYDAGYSNTLHIRGSGAHLSWDKGIPLKNIKANEWIYEIDIPFTDCEFKILINDCIYEEGENHRLHAGSMIIHTPHFPCLV